MDGAWWPCSDGLMTELPDLIAILSVCQGAISRVMYNLMEWRTTPTELVTG
jgi:acetylglutamate synthase